MTEKERITTILWNCDGIPYDKCKKAADALIANGFHRQSEGAWQEANARQKSSQFVCSACGGLAYFPQCNNSKTWQKHCPYKYCPNCGAKMKENLAAILQSIGKWK